MTLTTASRRVAATLAALGLAGCATFAPDGGFGAIEKTTQDRAGAQPR